MNELERDKKLSLFQLLIEDTDDKINSLKDKNFLDKKLTSISFNNELAAINSLFKNNDVKECVMHFLTFCKIKYILDNSFNYRHVDLGLELLSYSLFTNDNIFIKKVAQLNFNPSNGSSQNVIKSFILNSDIDLAIKNNRKYSNKMNSLRFDPVFFDALNNSDKDAMTFQLQKMCSKTIHNARNIQRKVRGSFISLPVNTYFKLAQYCGFELTIEHPLIVKELVLYKKKAEKQTNQILLDIFNEYL